MFSTVLLFSKQVYFVSFKKEETQHHHLYLEVQELFQTMQKMMNGFRHLTVIECLMMCKPFFVAVKVTTEEIWNYETLIYNTVR